MGNFYSLSLLFSPSKLPWCLCLFPPSGNEPQHMGEVSWDTHPLLYPLTHQLKNSGFFFLGVPVELSSCRVPLLCPAIFFPLKTLCFFSWSGSVWRSDILLCLSLHPESFSLCFSAFLLRTPPWFLCSTP